MVPCGIINMLFDQIPQRIKNDPNFIPTLNEGFVGDIKSQNIPGVQTLLDMTQNKRQKDSI